MDRFGTPQNNVADDSCLSGPSSLLNPSDPSGFRGTGGFGSPPSRKIPGADLNALDSANSLSVVETSKGVPGWVAVVTALLATVALVASSVVLKGKSDVTADTDSSQASAKASSSHFLPDSFQQREKAVAKARGLTTDDYIPSVLEKGRKPISKVLTYVNAGRTLDPTDAKVKIHLFTDFSCPMCAKSQAQSTEGPEELAKSGEV